MRIEPEMIPITLLPKEEKEIKVVFRSNETIEYNSELICKAITGKIC